MNSITGVCPVCDAKVNLNFDVHVSEVISCFECKSRLVVETIDKENAALAKAPDVEEDWGE